MLNLEKQFRLKFVNSWIQFKSKKVQDYDLIRYKKTICKAGNAVIQARRSWDVLNWNPKKWGEEEIEIALDALNHVEWNIHRLNDFLQYHDNNILKRYPWKPIVSKRMEYNWYTWEEMDIILKTARKCSPPVAFAVECVHLTIRPIGVLRMTMGGIKLPRKGQSGFFVTVDKGGKERIVPWDPDTNLVVERYLEWRKEQYQLAKEKYGKTTPDFDRALVFYYRGKIKPYGSTPEKGRSGFDSLLLELNKTLKNEGYNIKVRWYDIRHTVLDEIDIISKDLEQLSDNDVLHLTDWKKTETMENYRSERTILFRKIRAKKRQLAGRDRLRKEVLI